MTYFTLLPSPVDPLLLVGDGESLSGVYFQKHKGQDPMVDPAWKNDSAPFREAITQLEQYFAQERTSFELRLRPQGTEFQKQVWSELSNIAYGETISYGELAKRIHNPKAVRAVGLANGRNPISIIVPCHRVIGANGKLTGYGGGLERKRTLLELEAMAGLLNRR